MAKHFSRRVILAGAGLLLLQSAANATSDPFDRVACEIALKSPTLDPIRTRMLLINDDVAALREPEDALLSDHSLPSPIERATIGHLLELQQANCRTLPNLEQLQAAGAPLDPERIADFNTFTLLVREYWSRQDALTRRAASGQLTWSDYNELRAAAARAFDERLIQQFGHLMGDREIEPPVTPQR